MKKIIYLWLALGTTALAGNVLVDNTTKVLTSPTAAQLIAANPTLGGTSYNTPTGYLGSDKLVTTGTDGTMRADIGAGINLSLAPLTSATNASISFTGKGTGGITLQSEDGSKFITVSAGQLVLFSQDISALDASDPAAIALYSGIIGDGAGNPSIDSVARTLGNEDGIVISYADGRPRFGSPADHPFVLELNVGNLSASRQWQAQDRDITVAGLDDTVAEVFSSAPTTGSTVNPTYTKSKSLVALTPAGSLLALTVNMPNAATYPGGTWTLHSTQIITGLTLTPAGGSVIGATTTFAAVNGSCTYMSDGTDWRKVSGL